MGLPDGSGGTGVAPIDVGWLQDVAASVLGLLDTPCRASGRVGVPGDSLGASGDQIPGLRSQETKIMKNHDFLKKPGFS